MIDSRPSGYRAGDVVNGHQWTGAEWIESPSFPAAPPPAAPAQTGQTAHSVPPARGRWYGRPWLAVLGSTMGAIVIISTVSVGFGGSDGIESTSAVVPDPPTAVPQQQGEAPTGASFDPIVLTGTGDAIERVALPAEAGDVLVSAEYAGSGNFVVWALNDRLTLNELAVNQIDAYRGSAVISATTAALQVQAEGAWTITVQPLDEAPRFDGAASGSGSAVLVYTGGPGIATLATDAPGSFSVTQRPDRFSRKLLVNDFGPYRGQHIISAGPNILVIEADGDWTVTVE